jgi:hypothetical protein
VLFQKTCNLHDVACPSSVAGGVPNGIIWIKEWSICHDPDLISVDVAMVRY